MEQLGFTDKKKLWSLFDSVENKEAIVNKPTKTQNSDVLIVDLLNTVIRCFSVNPQLNPNGEHIGAVSGTLKSIGYAIRQIKPTRCILVCDGKGGSKRRRSIFPDYKQKRKTKIRLNRSYVDSSTSLSEDKNLLTQIQKLTGYFDYLPLTLMSVDDIEADDAIAFLAQETFKNSESVTIMSTDKDFYQLTNDRIKIWSPTKKRIYGENEIYSEFGIHPKNFIFYRSLEGDKSDNIDGIRGAGLATIKKCFPFLIESDISSVQQIIDHSKGNVTKYKIYENVLKNEYILNRNYELMQLNLSIIPSYLQLRINDLVSQNTNKLNKFEFMKLLTLDSMHEAIPNFHEWLSDTFFILDHYVKSS